MLLISSASVGHCVFGGNGWNGAPGTDHGLDRRLHATVMTMLSSPPPPTFPPAAARVPSGLMARLPCGMAPEARTCSASATATGRVSPSLMRSLTSDGHQVCTAEPELRQFTRLWTRLRHFVLDLGREDEITWNCNASANYTASSAYR